jgi:hypothetical protein
MPEVAEIPVKVGAGGNPTENGKVLVSKPPDETCTLYVPKEVPPPTVNFTTMVSEVLD